MQLLQFHSIFLVIFFSIKKMTNFIFLTSKAVCARVRKRKSRAVNSAYSGFYEAKTHTWDTVPPSISPHRFSEKKKNEVPCQNDS